MNQYYGLGRLLRRNGRRFANFSGRRVRPSNIHKLRFLHAHWRGKRKKKGRKWNLNCLADMFFSYFSGLFFLLSKWWNSKFSFPANHTCASCEIIGPALSPHGFELRYVFRIALFQPALVDIRSKEHFKRGKKKCFKKKK
jgi:hypothetical protein